jgi:hypothetical protein
MEKICLTLNIFLEEEFLIMKESAQLSGKEKLLLFLATFHLMDWMQLFLI